MRVWFVQFALLFIAIPGFSQEAFFIKIDGKTSEEYDLSFGTIVYDENFKPEMQDSDIESLDSMAQTIANALNAEDFLNVFIHGVWSHTDFVFPEMCENVGKDIFICKDDDRGVGLHIIWESKLMYQSSVPLAYDKGVFLSQFWEQLYTYRKKDYQINILAHSMGNKLFEGTVVALQERKSTVSFDHWLCVAADLNNEIFDEGHSLADVKNTVGHISVYIHNNDRTLKVSNVINDDKRLGIYGPNSLVEKDSSYFSVIDVSLVDDYEGFGNGWSNHRYFYTSPLVRQDLNRVLWRRDYDSGKKLIQGSNYYKLLVVKEN